jgi:predicted ABC-type ATPase
MWIIAGPNGAGKSTFTGAFLANLGHHGLRKLNADERTAELRRQNPGEPIRDLNIQAANDIDAQVAAAIEQGRSFCIETVLSSNKYRDDVEKARAQGFRVGIVYISIWPPELSPKRIKDRVAKGGHDVETQTAIRRYKRSHEQLTWFAGQVDQSTIAGREAAPFSSPHARVTKLR